MFLKMWIVVMLEVYAPSTAMVMWASVLSLIRKTVKVWILVVVIPVKATDLG